MAMTAEGFIAFLRDLRTAIPNDDLSAEQDELADIVRETQVDNFASEVDESGQAWAPRKRDYAHPPLRDTLAMYQAATIAGAPGNIEEKTPERLTLGISSNDVPYAKSHQEGDPSRNLPRRQYYYVNLTRRKSLVSPLKKGLRRIFFTVLGKHANGNGSIQ